MKRELVSSLYLVILSRFFLFEDIRIKMARVKLPMEIIEHIALSMPLPYLVSCKLVCKDWKETLSSEKFCREYTLHSHDFTDGEPTGFLSQWLTPEEWYCYWIEEYDGRSPEKWVFKNPPKQWKSGIVHPANLKPKADQDIKFTDFLVAMTIVNKLKKGAAKFDINCQAWGNESDGILQPFIMPWSKASLPRDEDIFELFNFHPKMRDGCQTEDIGEGADQEEDEDDSDDESITWKSLTSFEAGPGVQEFFQFLKTLFFPGVMMCIGCEAMNSVPVFYLTKLAPGWVGGYMSGVVCT